MNYLRPLRSTHVSDPDLPIKPEGQCHLSLVFHASELFYLASILVFDINQKGKLKLCFKVSAN